MNSKNDQIAELMSGIAATLREYGEDKWAWTFDRLRLNFIAEPGYGSAQIRSLYGGSNAFNDLVLSRDGVPLQAENDLLDRLREQLFQLVTYKNS